MSDRLVVQDAALTTLLRRFPQAGAILQRELETAGERAILGVEGLAKRHVPVDTGHLRRSITHEVRPLAGGIEAVAGTNVPYARIVEGADAQGNLYEWSRRPGQPLPPPGVLLGWMRRRGIPEGMEFALRRSISQKGIRARPYLSRALAELRPRIRDEFEAVPRRVLFKLREGSR